MKYALLLVAALWAAPSAAQADPGLDAMVERFQPMVGTRSPDGALVRRVWAEGRIMVLTAEAPATYSYGPNWISWAVASGICEQPDGPAFFQRGNAIRIEIVMAEGGTRSATRDACPTEAEPPSDS